MLASRARPSRRSSLRAGKMSESAGSVDEAVALTKSRDDYT
jgi:hypothetical protein